MKAFIAVFAAYCSPIVHAWPTKIVLNVVRTQGVGGALGAGGALGVDGVVGVGAAVGTGPVVGAGAGGALLVGVG